MTIALKKLTALLLAALLALAACGTQSPPDSTTAPPATSAQPATAPATTAPPATVPPTTAPPAGGVLTYPGLDYSHHGHPDEARYTTTLADLALLAQGKLAHGLSEAPAQWVMQFEGIRSDDIWGYDFRSMDVSGADLEGLDWNYFSYNTGTTWPDALPQGFDPDAVLEYCKNPGLGIRALHAQGITGAGVGVAIIDQALLPSHEEYAQRLMLYERIHCADGNAQMHGPAVASIAVGDTIGTAPGAKLYYIAETHGHFNGGGNFEFDAAVIGDSILRILEANTQLPESEKIRVISISRGYVKGDQGYDAVQAAIQEADAQGVFVITTSPGEFYDFKLMGMERDYLADPDDPNSWLPAEWLRDFYTNNISFRGYLWVPMGSRTYAGCHGDDAYELGRQGGLSWAVPWLAGFYAMCCQVAPDITPTQFIGLAYETATTVKIERDGGNYPMSKVINPAAVIEALQAGE